jgi:hypothetical protein
MGFAERIRDVMNIAWKCQGCGLVAQIPHDTARVVCTCGREDRTIPSPGPGDELRVALGCDARDWPHFIRMNQLGPLCIEHIDELAASLVSGGYAGTQHAARRLIQKAVDACKVRDRHCIYHVYATKANDIWRLNVDQLLSHVDAFNGRRIAAIACDGNTHSFDVAAKDLESAGFKCYEFPNDRELREVVTFLPLLCSVADVDRRDAVFYAHTKGNTTGDDPYAAAIWRNVAYRELLGEWRRCVELLEQFDAVGIHKMVWPEEMLPPYPTKLKHGHWMFAGTFFWFRAHAVFRREWRNVPIDRYGAEAYLAGLLEPDKVKSVYQVWPEEQYPTPSPYDVATYPTADHQLCDV